jgi:hypothetical protein
MAPPRRRDLLNEFRWSEPEAAPSRRPLSWRHVVSRLAEAVGEVLGELVFALVTCGLFLLMVAGVVAVTGAPVSSSWLEAIAYNWHHQPVATVGTGVLVLAVVVAGFWSLGRLGDGVLSRFLATAALCAAIVGSWLAYVITTCSCV